MGSESVHAPQAPVFGGLFEPVDLPVIEDGDSNGAVAAGSSPPKNASAQPIGPAAIFTRTTPGEGSRFPEATGGTDPSSTTFPAWRGPAAMQHSLLRLLGTRAWQALEKVRSKLVDSGQFEPISKEGDVIRIRSFGHGVDVKLADLLGSSESVTIDIRNNFGGSFEVMERCLALLIPKGEYAKLLTKRSKEPAPVSLSNGSERIRQITVVVDKGTAREADRIRLSTVRHPRLAAGPSPIRLG